MNPKTDGWFVEVYNSKTKMSKADVHTIYIIKLDKHNYRACKTNLLKHQQFEFIDLHLIMDIMQGKYEHWKVKRTNLPTQVKTRIRMMFAAEAI